MTISHDKKIFERLLQQAGIPITEAEYSKQWKDLVNDEGYITNTSDWSPFWRLINLMITRPAANMSQFFIEYLLPNTYLKTASGEMLDLLGYNRQITRRGATKLRGSITLIRRGKRAALTVPAGVVITSVPINGAVYKIITIQVAEFSKNDVTASVVVDAMEPGTASNLAPGYYSILPEDLEDIRQVSMTNDWIITPGTDIESDDHLRERIKNKFSSIGRWHHDAAYRDIIARLGKIPVNYIWFEHNAPRGPGTANAYVMSDFGPPSENYIKKLNADLRDSQEAGFGDDLQIYAIPSKKIDLSPVIYINRQLSEDQRMETRNDFENILRCAFRQNNEYKAVVTRTIPFKKFSFSKLSEELHDELPDLISVEFKRDDIEKGNFLPELENLTITEHYTDVL